MLSIRKTDQGFNSRYLWKVELQKFIFVLDASLLLEIIVINVNFILKKLKINFLKFPITGNP